MTTTTTTQVQQYCCQIALITLTFCYLEFSSALACLPSCCCCLCFCCCCNDARASTKAGHEYARRRRRHTELSGASFSFCSLACVRELHFRGCRSAVSLTHAILWRILDHTHTHAHTDPHTVYIFLCKHKNNNSKQKFLCCRCEFFSFIFYVNDNARVLSSALCIFILITRQLEINSSHFSPRQHFIHTLQNY